MLKQGGLLALANLINRSAGLLLLPVYTRWLSPADYGFYALVLSVLEVLAMLCGAGLAQAMTRLYFDHPEGDPRRDQLVSTTLLAMLGMLSLFCVGAPWLAAPLTLLLSGDFASRGDLVAIALPSVPASVLLDILVAYFSVRKRPFVVLLLACAKALSLIGLNLLFLFVLERGLWGVFAAQSLAFGGIAVGCSALLLHRFGAVFDLVLLRQLLRLGVPLVPSVVADTVSGALERWLVNHLLGGAALGAWALSQRVAFTIQAFLSTPFAQSFLVRRLEAQEKGHAQAPLNRVLSAFFIVLGLAVFSLALFAPEIVRLLAPGGFEAAVRILPVSALCVALTAVNFHVEIGLLFNKRTGVVSMISLVSLCATAPAIWVGVQSLGLAGAPVAQCAIILVRLAATWRVNRRLGLPDIGTGWLPGLATLLVLFCVGMLALNLGTSQGWLGRGLPITAADHRPLEALALKTVVLLSLVLLIGRSPLVPAEWRWRVGRKARAPAAGPRDGA
jgi:O-antigen/teichoic acid export membrane protein